MFDPYRDDYSIYDLFSQVISINKDLLLETRRLRPAREHSSHYVVLYGYLSASNRVYGDMEHLISSLMNHIIYWVEKALYNAFVTRHDISSLLSMLVDELVFLAENDFIDQRYYSEAVENIKSRIEHMGTDELASRIFDTLSPSLNWIRKNIVLNTCSRCGRGFVSISHEAWLYLLGRRKMIVPKEMIELCPRCRRTKLLHTYIQKLDRRIRDATRTKGYRPLPYERRWYKEYSEKLNELCEKYRDELRVLDKKNLKKPSG